MGEIVDLHNRQPTAHDDSFSAELVQDLARYSEGLVSEKDIKRRYRFDDATWESLNNDALIAAVEDSKTQRVRSGQAKIEKAQALIVKGPDVLSNIFNDAGQPARNRVDAIKTLDGMTAANGSTAAAGQSDRFIITINLSADGAGGEPKILHFDKSIAIDVDPLNNTDTTLEESAFAATKPYKPKDDDQW